MSAFLIALYTVGGGLAVLLRLVAGNLGHRAVVTNSAMWTALVGLMGTGVGRASQDLTVTLVTLVSIGAYLVGIAFLVAMIWPEKDS